MPEMARRFAAFGAEILGSPPSLRDLSEPGAYDLERAAGRTRIAPLAV
jgi:hypothetical protein